MNKEEKEAITEAKKQIEEAHNLNDINVFMTDSTTLKTLLNLIDKLQKENENYKKLILDIKEKLNNIQFEVEQAWRKIEKLEDKNE